MRGFLCVLALTALAAAQCPLGLSPAEACPEGSPRCGLYVDATGDGRCDNPGPLPVTDHEPVPVPEPDPEPDLLPDPEPEEVSHPEPPPVEDPSPVQETGPVHSVTAEEPAPEPAAPEIAEEPVEDEPPDSLPEPAPLFVGCPLNLAPEEACPDDAPKCALFIDETGSGFCDNPLDEEAPEDSVAAVIVTGCPLGLPPEAACTVDRALCPHWYGVSSGTRCANPPGGERRIYIALVTLSILMILSTYLSRRLRGRKIVPRLRRTVAHRTVQGLSLIVLGFGIQGCFCPLGAFQYAFLKDGLVFLGAAGLALLLIPFVFAAFFGRIFCCWVCPMGAIQEMAFLIPSPGKLNPKGKTSRLFGRFRFVVLGAVLTILLLSRHGLLSTSWPAVFCRFDPFHTIFTLFLTGSLMVAGITIILSIFVRRFFCRYLCFMGAALSLFTPLRLYSRITGTTQSPPSSEDF